MSPALPGRPEPGEYPSYAQAYIDKVEGGDIQRALSEQLEWMMSTLSKVDDDVAGSFVYAPGKWTIKQVLGHITDTERIFSYRALRIARNDATPLSGFEQDDYIPFARSNECSLASLLDEFKAVRQATIALFRNLPADAWLRNGTANNASVTVRGIAFQAAGHEAHHAKILRDRYLTFPDFGYNMGIFRGIVSMARNLDYTMIIVSNMAQSVEFYRDQLGLTLKFESPDWTEFVTGTTTLALHGGGARRNTQDSGDSTKSAGVCSIGFNVADVDKTYVELKAKGVHFVMPPTQRDGEGIKLAVCIDPDGLPISFAQMR